MGRGRAKAKQQKVARELKYNSSHMTDLEALQRELGGASGSAHADFLDDDEDDDDEDDATDADVTANGRWASGER